MKIVWVAGMKEENTPFAGMIWYTLRTSEPERGEWHTAARYRGSDVASEAYYRTKEAARRMAEACTYHCNTIHAGRRRFSAWIKARRVP